MKPWVRNGVLAVVFVVVGAIATSLWLEVRRETPAAAGAKPGVWEGRRIRVEVLNGAGVDGLALKATERLRDHEFDVVYYGNAEGFDRDSSVALARIREIEPARRAADALGIRRVQERPDDNLYLDVTVILGRDWARAGDDPDSDARTVLETWWLRFRRAVRRLWPN